MQQRTHVAEPARPPPTSSDTAAGGGAEQRKKKKKKKPGDCSTVTLALLLLVPALAYPGAGSCSICLFLPSSLSLTERGSVCTTFYCRALCPI